MKRGKFYKSVDVFLNQIPPETNKISVNFARADSLLKSSFIKQFKYIDLGVAFGVCSKHSDSFTAKESEDELTKIKDWFAEKGYN